MCYIDAFAASRSALDLAARLTSGGRTRIDADDVLDHLDTWEPGAAPVAVRIVGNEFVVTTAADVSISTKRLLKAYGPPCLDVVFRVMDGVDAE